MPFYNTSPRRLFLSLVVMIALTEALVMFIMFYASNGHFSIDAYHLQEALIDSALLCILLSPAIYFSTYKPFEKNLQRLTKSELELLEIHADLERRVNERTTQLRQSQGLLRAFMDNAPVQVAVRDTDGRFEMLNRQFLKRSGIAFSEKEAIGKRTDELFPDWIADSASAADRRVIETGETVITEEDNAYRDGGKILFTKFPLLDEVGNVEKIGIIGLDITQQKLTEKALQESMFHHKQAVEQANLAFWRWAFDEGQHTYWSDNYGEILFSRSDMPLSYQDMMASVYPDDRNRLLQTYLDADKNFSEFDVEYRVVGPEGRIRYIQEHASVEYDEQGKPVAHVGIIQDITKYKLSEEKLRTLSRIVEQNPASIVIADIKGLITYANAAFTKITGYSTEEVQGINTSILQSGNTPREVYDDMWQSIEKGLVWNGEIQNRRKDGTMYWGDLTIAPILDSDGTVVNYAGICSDITSRRHTEQELLQIQKMEAIGNLTGGIAHDFNNILGVALGNLQLIQRRSKNDEKLLSLGDSAVEAILHGSDLTKQLLAFSRRQELAPKTVDANQLINGMVDMLRRTLGEAVHIKTELSEGLCPLNVDPGQLEASILNLAINARDAMPNGGALHIKTDNAILGENYVQKHSFASTGRHICISVSDTGTGIPDDVMGDIFEPFFTTKEVGKGTGLGLSMLYGFVKQSGGHVTVYSEVNEGTTFRIYLPSTSGPCAPATPIDRAYSEPPKGVEKILLVEDDEGIRITAIQQLEELGYTVVSACDGPDALRKLEDLGHIDLLFTDMIMPGGMNGQELGEKLLERRPELPILLTSGYPRDSFKEGRKFPMISKPYTIDNLAVAVRKALRKIDIGVV